MSPGWVADVGTSTGEGFGPVVVIVDIAGTVPVVVENAAEIAASQGLTGRVFAAA